MGVDDYYKSKKISVIGSLAYIYMTIVMEMDQKGAKVISQGKKESLIFINECIRTFMKRAAYQEGEVKYQAV